MTRRLRGDAGVSVVEMVATVALMLTVITPLLVNMGSAMTKQQRTAASAYASAEGRVGLEQLAKDIRASASVVAGMAPDQVIAWIDDDADGSVDPGEEITYAIAAGNLTRTDGAATRTLVGDLTAGSSLKIVAVAAGSSVEVNLVIDASPGAGASPVTLHTEVFPRA